MYLVLLLVCLIAALILTVGIVAFATMDRHKDCDFTIPKLDTGIDFYGESSI